MILKTKERGNAPQLARYLLAMRENGFRAVSGYAAVLDGWR